MKTVLITGGSRGIGRAMVELFSKEGYLVAFTYKNSENEAKSLAEATGALAIRADSASEEDVLRAVKLAEEHLGGIGCLINNAGVSSFSLFTDLTLEDWNRFISVNLTGAFLYSKAVIPGMVHRKSGSIINISSMWGIVGSSCEVHYSTTKAALIGMTKALAKELGPSGIRVNAIAPGVIATDMNRALGEEDIAVLKDETPLMKIGSPLDVAKAALFLAGDGADFITGEVMNISGGYVM
ncbi:MAG: 3-oxoacyl-ACP reductase FabG [Clostridia bacterium]|nr:3-oxoacyl-ACP reductase FabG [Clostridia bacterium]